MALTSQIDDPLTMETAPSRNQVLFARSDQRVLTGVSSGLGEFLGVDPWVVRAGFILMGLASGVGLVVYAAAYLLSGRPDESATRYPATQGHAVGFISISLGISIIGGELLVQNIGTLAHLRTVWLAVFGTMLLVALVASPWFLRLVSQVGEERRDRIRSEERADISAHLHDSVLNTLALIQRSEAKPEVVMLARRQERELRAWMQGRLADETTQLDAAIDGVVTRVEEQYNVSVDAVVVGGALPMNDHISALVAAVQESAVNAARHSGVNSVSVYVEVGDDDVTAFVRDQGKGFDRSAVDEDRRGIADSIEGRMRRVGGSASIRSAIGEGTEVELKVSRD
jgi:signal transduction histidine kinase